ncbi:MAG: dodecin domain-containing protein [Promethearchaeota archaeon]|nr:MAG: dodecin domain-containing protein [Candidatus Lokiarchaeota archaeon]
MAVYKSIELVGTSKENWADAVRNAYLESKKTLRGIRNIEIIRSDVKVKEDIDELLYRVRCQVTFEIEK